MERIQRVGVWEGYILEASSSRINTAQPYAGITGFTNRDPKSIASDELAAVGIRISSVLPVGSVGVGTTVIFLNR